MAENLVELAATTVDHLTDKYYEQGYDKFSRTINGKPVERTYTPYARPQQTSGDPPSATASRSGKSATAATAPSVATARRRQRNQLPSPERNSDRGRKPQGFPRVRDLSEDRQSETSCEVIRAYERETDDSPRKPESVLSAKQLRRDSAAMTSYNDGYEQTQYSSSRPRSQPPRTKYYDDGDDSDYDERTGRRYPRGSGRGYDDREDRDDRDYDRIVETTERYRGPPVERPWDPARRESSRDGPYGAGAVTQYGRRSEQDLKTSYSSRRSKSRGRGERERDRSYSRSRSRSREGIREKFEDHFDTSGRGLGVGLAGAVIGGLAGRELGGNSRHRQRDMIIGAIVGGLGANVAENKWRDWKDDKKEKLERDEDRWEQKFDGRSRSSIR